MNPPRKILIILSHTGGGGDTQVVYNLLYALGESGLEFHFLTPQRGSLHADFRRFGEVHTFPIDDTNLPRRMLRRFLRPLYTFAKERYGTYLIRKLRPEVVYINTVNEHEFSRAAVAAAVRKVVHIHEMGFVVTQRMSARWIDTLLGAASAVVSPAVAVSDFYRDVFGVDAAKLHVIHETVSERRLREQLSGADVRQRLGIDAGTLLIGAVGSVIYRKGADTLVRAAALLRRQRPGLRFAVVWLGGDPALLERQTYYRALQSTLAREGLGPFFRFVPHRAAVGDFYAQLDIFVLPSRMEAFPLVVLEALLSEKPVVAMDVAGVREVIDAETGYLVKDRTPEGLAEGIGYFVENEDRRLAAGRAGRQRVLARFEASVQVKKWLQLLNSV